MTRAELLQLAKEVGAGYIDPPSGDFLTFDVDSDQLERFAALVAAREREECAKVCEQYRYEFDGNCIDAAFAIRARGQKGWVEP